MTSTALDTSVIVASVLSEHERHEDARAAVGAALAEPGGCILPLHALCEAYSVLTRIPAPNRLSPVDAQNILLASFRAKTRLVSVDAGEAWHLLEGLASSGIAGGLLYDALILESARRAGAAALLTLNCRHFDRLKPGSIRVIEP